MDVIGTLMSVVAVKALEGLLAYSRGRKPLDC